MFFIQQVLDLALNNNSYGTNGFCLTIRDRELEKQRTQCVEMPAARGYGTFSAGVKTWSHTAVDVKVERLSYVVCEKHAKLWQRLVALQMPWEVADTVRLQVLQDVSFVANSGTMLAILGSSGKGAFRLFCK